MHRPDRRDARNRVHAAPRPQAHPRIAGSGATATAVPSAEFSLPVGRQATIDRARFSMGRPITSRHGPARRWAA